MYEINCFDTDGNTINNFFQWDIDQKIIIHVTGKDSDYLRIAPEVHFTNNKRTDILIVRSLFFGVICVDDANIMSQPDDSSNIVGTLHSGDAILYTPYTEYTNNNNNNLIINTTYLGGDKTWCVVEYNSNKCYIKSACIERNVDTIVADVPNILLQESCPLLVYVYLTNSDDVSSQRTILYTEIPVRKRNKPSDYLYVDNISRVTANMIKDELTYAVKETRAQAINDITNTKNIAQQIVETKKQEFIDTGDGLIDEAISIKNQAQQTYDNIMLIADETIEIIISTITANGLILQSKNDGSGNITFFIGADE